MGEVSLLNAILEGFVEHRVKLVLRRDVQALVVGFNIFLDRLTAVVAQLISQFLRSLNATGRAKGKSRAREVVEISYLLPLLSLSCRRMHVSHIDAIGSSHFHRADGWRRG